MPVVLHAGLNNQLWHIELNKMIKSEKSQNGTKCGDLVASLDYVHDYRFIIHIAKQLAKKQLSPIHFFHLIHSFNTGKWMHTFWQIAC